MKNLDGTSRDPGQLREGFLLGAVKMFPLSMKTLEQVCKSSKLINPENNKPFQMATYRRDIAYMRENGYLMIDRADRYALTDKGTQRLNQLLP